MSRRAALAQTYTCTVTVHEDGAGISIAPVATPAPTGVPTEAPSETPTVLPTESETPTAALRRRRRFRFHQLHAHGNTDAWITVDMMRRFTGTHRQHLVNGVTTVHEHGDAPPEWVLAYNRTSGIGEAGTGRPAYEHVAGTPNENGHDAGAWWKHTAFKGWAGRFQNVDWYGIFHLDFNPVGIPAGSIPTRCGSRTPRVRSVTCTDGWTLGWQ